MGVAAVASNNIVSIEQTKDLEKVENALKTATSKEADAKLKGYQKRVILMNESLLHLHAKKVSIVLIIKELNSFSILHAEIMLKNCLTNIQTTIRFISSWPAPPSINKSQARLLKS